MKKVWFAAFLLFTVVYAVHAEDCPEGSSLVQVVDAGSETQYHCKCVPGRVLIGGRCKVCEIADQQNLMKQYSAAMQGIQSSLESLDFEKKRVRLEGAVEDLRNVKLKLTSNAMILMASPDPAKLPTATVLFLGELTNFLVRVDTEIQKDSDVKTAVENIKNFQTIAKNKSEAIRTCLTTAGKL